LKKLLLSEPVKVILVLALILLIFYREIAFEGKTFLIENKVSGVMPSGPYGYLAQETDTTGNHARDTGAIAWGYEPSTKYFRDRLRQGEFALWKNNPGLGSPLIADGMSLSAEPLLGLTYICPSRWWSECMDVVVLLRFLIAGWFTYLFSRRLQLSFWTAVFAGAAFMLSYQIVIFGNSPQLPAQILIPALLWGFDLLADRPTPVSLALTALIIAWTIISGLSEAAFLSILIGVLWYLFRVFWSSRTNGSGKSFWFNRLGWGIGASLAGLGLSAWFWIPLVENIANSITTHAGGQGLRVFSAKALVLTLLPPIEINAMIPSFRTVVATLAIAAMFALPKMGRKIWPALFFFGYFLIFGLEQYGVAPFKWIGYLPGFNQITIAHYMTATVNFSLILLAALGLDFIRCSKRNWWPLLLSFLFQLVLLVSLNSMIRDALGYSWTTFLSKFGIVFAFILTAVITYFFFERIKKLHHLPIMFLTLFVIEILFIHGNIPYPQRYYPYARPPLVPFLRNAGEDHFRIMGFDQVLYPNVGMVYGMDDLRYLDAIDPTNRSLFFNTLISEAKFGDRLSGTEPSYSNNIWRMFDLLNVRYVLATNDYQPGLGINLSEVFPLVYDAEVKIFENTGAMPRAFILYAAEKSESLDVTLARLADPDFDPFSTALIEKTYWSSLIDALPEAPLEKWKTAQVTRRSANQIEIAVKSDTPGLLILSETFFPGWQAFLNSTRVDLFPVDGMLRGVVIPAGDHQVHFVYHPSSFFLGLLIGIVSVIFLTMAIFCSSSLFKYMFHNRSIRQLSKRAESKINR
jgi:hypothetical protein